MKGGKILGGVFAIARAVGSAGSSCELATSRSGHSAQSLWKPLLPYVGIVHRLTVNRLLKVIFEAFLRSFFRSVDEVRPEDILGLFLLHGIDPLRFQYYCHIVSDEGVRRKECATGLGKSFSD